jgi:hypothetical protein
MKQVQRLNNATGSHDETKLKQVQRLNKLTDTRPLLSPFRTLTRFSMTGTIQNFDLFKKKAYRHIRYMASLYIFRTQIYT